MDTSPASLKTHMLAVEFARHPGDLGAAAIVLVDGPKSQDQGDARYDPIAGRAPRLKKPMKGAK